MKQVVLEQGRVTVQDVPAPSVEPGTILVRVLRSCISTGTELSGLKSGGLPLWRRALAQPAKVKKALSLAATQGIVRTWQQVKGQVQAGIPTGYSAAGEIVAIGDGEGARGFAVGDLVACAGAQCAHHAEFIRVPYNLCVPVPERVTPAEASTVTLGAIALQGVRRGQPTLGETFVVIGIGLLGQITAQLLKADGCRVIGVDLDRGRLDLARRLGMELAVHPDDGDDVQAIARLTDGVGADGVIITAATPSDEVVSAAFRMCRKKARVVLVGDVGLALRRGDFYEKELDFLISSSYGPGRYDRAYEERGLDYPVGYVRWTENRNMTAYLGLIAQGSVDVKPLIAGELPIEQADEAYARLGSEARPLAMLLSYEHLRGEPRRTIELLSPPRRTGALRLALVGAGAFAKGSHLPNLASLGAEFQLRTVVSRSGHNAKDVASRFGAAIATTDHREAFADPEIDAVLIATRHHLHAGLVVEAVSAGKSVFVEKPLALTASEIADLERAVQATGPRPPLVMTGFNRRFSPIVSRIQELIAGRSGPLVITYRMNAGRLADGHWVHGLEGGGRNRGEACHVYDLFTCLTGAAVVDVKATATRSATRFYRDDDNFAVILRFADGSLCSLVYTACGHVSSPKERMEIFVDGKALLMEDYRSLTVDGGPPRASMRLPLQDKGQRQALKAFATAASAGGPWPIPWWQQVQATDIAIKVEAVLHPEAMADGGTGS